MCLCKKELSVAEEARRKEEGRKLRSVAGDGIVSLFNKLLVSRTMVMMSCQGGCLSVCVGGVHESTVMPGHAGCAQ